MNSVVREILKRDIQLDKKLIALSKLEGDIEDAKRVLSREYGYCPECDDTYLSRSFFYTEGMSHNSAIFGISPRDLEPCVCTIGHKVSYRVCPKGHKLPV